MKVIFGAQNLGRLLVTGGVLQKFDAGFGEGAVFHKEALIHQRNSPASPAPTAFSCGTFVMQDIAKRSAFLRIGRVHIADYIFPDTQSGIQRYVVTNAFREINNLQIGAALNLPGGIGARE